MLAGERVENSAQVDTAGAKSDTDRAAAARSAGTCTFSGDNEGAILARGGEVDIEILDGAAGDFRHADAEIHLQRAGDLDLVNDQRTRTEKLLGHLLGGLDDVCIGRGPAKDRSARGIADLNRIVADLGSQRGTQILNRLRDHNTHLGEGLAGVVQGKQAGPPRLFTKHEDRRV